MHRRIGNLPGTVWEGLTISMRACIMRAMAKAIKVSGLRDFRRLVEMTTRDVGLAAGVDQSTVVRAEQPGTNPELDTIDALLKWAAKVADERKLPASQRLTFEKFRSGARPRGRAA